MQRTRRYHSKRDVHAGIHDTVSREARGEADIGVARSSTAVVKYTPSDICNKYLIEARGHVPPVSDYDFTHFNFTHLLTNLAAE